MGGVGGEIRWGREERLGGRGLVRCGEERLVRCGEKRLVGREERGGGGEIRDR